jgi:hypothetical protein
VERLRIIDKSDVFYESHPLRRWSLETIRLSRAAGCTVHGLNFHRDVSQIFFRSCCRPGRTSVGVAISRTGYRSAFPCVDLRCGSPFSNSFARSRGNGDTIRRCSIGPHHVQSARQALREGRSFAQEADRAKGGKRCCRMACLQNPHVNCVNCVTCGSFEVVWRRGKPIQ